MRVLTRFLADAKAGGAALLLTGEPGVGKSRLVEVATARAEGLGTRVVAIQGEQSASMVRFAGLDQLISPLREGLPAIPLSAQRALTTALAMSDGQPSSYPVVANAALALLRQAAQDRPALAVVDDAQWLDPASASVLAFLSRRLVGCPLGVLIATRTGCAGDLETSDLPELEVRTLGEAAATALLTTDFPQLAHEVRQQILSKAAGNPTALGELPLGLTAGQQRGREPLPPTWPLTARLAGLFQQQLDTVPPSSRELLLLAALERSGDLDVLQSLQTRDVLPLLGPVERAGLALVDLHAGTLSFRHPIVADTVINAALPLERRRAHRVLAAALTHRSEARAWHLAEGSVGPDEDVAALLEAAAWRARALGDYGTTAAALARAAQLSASRQAHSRRLRSAAWLTAEVAGDLDAASDLAANATDLDEDADTDPTPGEVLAAAVANAILLVDAEPRLDEAHTMLVTAINALPNRRPDPTATKASDNLIDALHLLVRVCWLAGREELWASAVPLLHQPTPPGASLELSVRSVGDPVRAAGVGLRQLDEAVARLPEMSDALEITRVGVAAIYTDRLVGCRAALTRVADESFHSGRTALFQSSTVLLGFDGWQRGLWDETLQRCHDALALSRSQEYSARTVPLNYLQALIGAARGKHDQARATARGLAAWAELHGVGLAAMFAHHIESVSAQAAGDFEEAYRHAAAVSPAGSLAPYSPLALWVLLDLVESAAATGRTRAAEQHVGAIETRDVAGISPRLRLVAGACAAVAVAGQGHETLSRFAAALSEPQTAQWGFDHARVQLAYGTALQQARALPAAREQLLASLATFEQLGAPAWSCRARQALLAAGLQPRGDGAGWAVALTPLELELADLAASGLTNKQIGRILYISPRTVSTRLYHLFPKLGVSTRAALRDALRQLP